MLQALGKVVVAAGGTPVPVTQNLTAAEIANPASVQSIVVQTLPANTGLIYVRAKGPLGDDRTTRRWTIAILPVPVSATQGPFASVTLSVPVIPASLALGDIYIDAAVNGEGALVTVTRG